MDCTMKSSHGSSDEYRSDGGTHFDEHHGISGMDSKIAQNRHARLAAANFLHNPNNDENVERQAGSSENYWVDKEAWNGKIGASPTSNTRRCTVVVPREPETAPYRYLQPPLAAAVPKKTPIERQAPRKRDKTIEVSPGEFLRLRGADETWRAVQVDFYMPCECVCCLLTLFCIQDARFVLCPDCRVIGPMEGAADACEGSSGDGGVGLGFKLKDLAKWQDNIAKERMVARRM